MMSGALAVENNFLNTLYKAKNDFLTILKFDGWTDSLVALKEKYFVNVADEKNLKDYSDCFDDLVNLQDIICDVFKCCKPTLKIYTDAEDGETFLKVCVPLNKGSKNNYRDYESVCEKWFKIASQDTIDKVIIDLV